MPVKNRLVRSATMIAAASGGKPTDEFIERHSELARGGVGLVITGFMIPTRADASYERQIFIYDDDHIPGLVQVAQAVHEADGECRLFAQIGHSGETVSPSGIKWPWKKKGRVLATDEVDAIVDEFADAIWRVKAAGFDGVELHAAHAYLLSSFLSPLTNQRTDKYGGSLENRVHIIRAIMDQARARVGSDFPILIKVNSDDDARGGIRPADFPALANEIVKTGVVAIDVSGNDCLRKGIEDSQDEAYFYPGAEPLDVGVPVILTGGNRSLEHMEELLQTNQIDLLGMARPLIRQPDLPKGWLRGTADNRATCISCNGCFNVILQGKTAYCVQDA
jgi:2,4-dienoyl-CoA reductase-like NADH-dependent reductase (Old Yellow Enzyme family)